MYHATRSKKLVFFFVRSQSKCKLSKSYRDQKKYYASVLKRRAENDNVFIPLNISVDRSITFAIDNIDLKIDRYTWWKTSAAWKGYCGISTKI